MVKKQTLAGLAGMALCLSFSSCHDEISPSGDSRQGSISPLVELNTAVNTSSKYASKAGPDVTVDDLTLTISSEDGSFTKSWTPLTEYDPETLFAIGNYNVEVSYGDVNSEGFECPAYAGSQKVTVRENETTPVSITATLANTMVSIEYTDAFKKYMADYDANIHSAGGQYVYFWKEETRPAYLAPGDLTLNISFTKPNGQSATVQAAKFKAVARYHYHVKVDMENGAGDGVIIISLDETVDQEEYRIELSDELFNYPAPTVTGAGDLVNGSYYTHVVGDNWTTPLKANIIAKGKLASVTVTTKSKSLISQGWPAEVDLMSADGKSDAMQARLRQLGFDCKGIWNNPETMAVLDFTNVINHLTESDDPANNFTIVVTDAMTKVSEPFAFAVNTTNMTLELSNPAALMIGQTDFALDLNYNGMSPDDKVSFEYQNIRGTWTPLTVKSITAAGTDNYRVALEVPADNTPLTVRAVASGKYSNAITVERTAPEYSASFDEKDVWAHKATIALACEQVDVAALLPLATVYVSTDGTNFTAAGAKVVDGELEVSGLTAGTRYTVKVSLTENAAQCCAPLTITTESPLAVPNGDFEQLTESMNESELLQGGRWSISAGIYYDSYAQYTVSEPTGWASVNAKTNSGSTRNTWFCIPSTFNTSLTYSSTVPPIRFVGTGGGTETPASYKGFTAQSGSNAMVVRNVAWDGAGTRPANWKKEFVSADEHYNHNVPTIANKSAGKLFLGSYSYIGGTETYNEGTAFASRPASLSGYYTYTCDSKDSSEAGTVTVKVLNGSTVIAQGSGRLTAASSYKQFNVPLTYIAGAPKATSVQIMFCSSDKTNEASIQVTAYNSRYEAYHHGATLVVDNLSFNY